MILWQQKTGYLCKKENFWADENVLDGERVEDMKLYTFVKIYQTVYLRFLHFAVYELCLSEETKQIQSPDPSPLV